MCSSSVATVKSASASAFKAATSSLEIRFASIKRRASADALCAAVQAANAAETVPISGPFQKSERECHGWRGAAVSDAVAIRGSPAPMLGHYKHEGARCHVREIKKAGQAILEARPEPWRTQIENRPPRWHSCRRLSSARVGQQAGSVCRVQDRAVILAQLQFPRAHRAEAASLVFSSGTGP